MNRVSDEPDFDRNTEIVVVVPVYKPQPEPEEMVVFNHNSHILRNYPVVLVAPQDLNVGNYTDGNSVQVEFFPSHFFQNIAGYNRLMLSEEFYSRFNSYKYILICQTDVFVFKDELDEWCKKDYDYVGAPWINKPLFLFQYVLAKMGFGYAIKMLFGNNLSNAVGNGGFSLRKISTFLKVLQANQSARKWTANEDFFWSFFAKIDGRRLYKPTATEAGLFCIELAPEKMMKRQNHVLPMGIHAWKRYNPKFWEKYINNSLAND
jgi:hypothetical protein